MHFQFVVVLLKNFSVDNFFKLIEHDFPIAKVTSKFE